MTPKQLVRQFGLAKCAEQADSFSPQQLRGLARIADEYGKSEFHSRFLASLRGRKAAQRTPGRITPGSMLEALATVGGVAAPYAWYSLARDGRVILHTWRTPEPGRMDGWQIKDGKWTLDSRWSPRDAAWKSLPQYTSLLNALDTQAGDFGDVVYAAISTDATGGVGRAKRVPGSNVFLTNSNGSPAEFCVAFDIARRWHSVALGDGQDCNVGAA